MVAREFVCWEFAAMVHKPQNTPLRLNNGATLQLIFAIDWDLCQV